MHAGIPLPWIITAFIYLTEMIIRAGMWLIGSADLFQRAPRGALIYSHERVSVQGSPAAVLRHVPYRQMVKEA